MLLGTSPNNDNFLQSETLIIQLILQQRYAEVYELLINQQPISNAGLYNMALCLHWSGNYNEALSSLERIQLAAMISNGNMLTTNNVYMDIKSKQNQTNDYLQGMRELYIKCFPVYSMRPLSGLKQTAVSVGQLCEGRSYSHPASSQGYKNITEALKLANTANDKRI